MSQQDQGIAFAEMLRNLADEVEVGRSVRVIVITSREMAPATHSRPARQGITLDTCNTNGDAEVAGLIDLVKTRLQQNMLRD